MRKLAQDHAENKEQKSVANALMNKITGKKIDVENLDEVSRMKEAWQNIDNGYAEHIRSYFPEINLNQL